MENRPFAEHLSAGLALLEDKGLRRTLEEPRGIDFTSNDYLGLSRHPELRARLLERLRNVPLGAPASRLLGGTRREHQELEARLATFKGTEAALLFPSGYQANLALLGTVIAPEDRVISDRFNHASIIDALRLSGCKKVIVPHLDLERIETALRERSGGRTFLVTESLFSMDGDLAPLGTYAALCERHGAELIVDDAHAIGIYGSARGSGLTEAARIERRAAAVVSTFGKALGAAGACVAGSRILIDSLVQRARPFIFSTAFSPLLVAAVSVSLDLIGSEPDRRRRVLRLGDHLRSALRAHGIDTLGRESPIVPVLLGQNQRALAVAAELAEAGYDVRAIRPPTVPEGSARLRISVHADHEEKTLDDLATAIARAMRTHRAHEPG